MQDIKLRMLDVPSQIRQILPLIKRGSPNGIKLLAEVPLRNLKRKAEDSLKAAKETEQKFNYVKLLLDEVTAVTTASQVRKLLKTFMIA